MNKISYSMLAIIATAALSACFSDDSTLGYGNDGDLKTKEITVSGFEESYVKTAYVGEHLTITPEISGYADSELEYQWMLIDAKTGTENSKGETIEPIILGTDKNLDYEVALAPGNYQIRLYTTVKSTGLQVVSYAGLQVQTNFSQGFYILKETADGNTELDLLTKDNEMAVNLLENTQGSAMSGKPLNMTPNYGVYYIDTESDEMATATAALNISTENKGFAILRTTDLKCIIDRSNAMYESMNENEDVYGSYQTGMGYTYLFTSAGIYSADCDGGYNGQTSGKFGIPVTEWEDGSPYFYNDVSSYGGGAIWNAATHSLTAYNYNADASPLTYTDRTGTDVTQNLTDFECLYCGYNNMGTPYGIFILKEKSTGDRYVYIVKGGFRGQYLTSRTKLTGHMATATYYGTCAKSASYIYCVDGGKLYACNFATGNFEEVELQPKGIGSGETITYVADQFWSSTFDNIIVGTQNGNNYKLYFYEVNGGAPIGDPIKTAEGTGTVKKVRYINPTVSMFSITYYYGMNAND